MFAKTLIVSLLSLGALVAAIPVDTETTTTGENTAVADDAAAPPPRGPPRGGGGGGGGFRGPEPRPFRGEPGRPGFVGGGAYPVPVPVGGISLPYPVVVPVPVGGGAPSGSLEQYCASLNIPNYQLPAYVSCLGAKL